MCEGGGVLTALTLIGIALALSGVILGSVSLSEVRDMADSQSKVGAQSAPTPVPINTAPNSTASSETLDEIVARGFLRCGIPDGQNGFAVKADDGTQIGFDADLCRAVAAAMFGTSDGKVEFTPLLSSGDRWTFLQNKSIDVMARVSTITMERDVHEPSVGAGFEFTMPYLYNGVGFGGRQPYLDCVEQRNFTGECSTVLICVSQGTTHVEIVGDWAPSANVLPVESANALYTNFIEGSCNVITEEQTGISATVLELKGYTENDYVVGTTQFSKEPLAVVTREGDAFWSDFVYWVVESLFSAEERDIEQANANEFPETSNFGDAYTECTNMQ
ncbi:Bacterial periplasmic substrate-binding protein [Fragilaria crotonensis]|nr:Bacterial periplasmic substrate-binding protein [Fragilaria crotonensis]